MTIFVAHVTVRCILCRIDTRKCSIDGSFSLAEEGIEAESPKNRYTLADAGLL